MVNLKTLAAHLNLSQATVSRGLNGFPEVAEKTRKRINDAARELGYFPNPTAQMLATGRANTVGFVFRAETNIFLDPHFTEFLAGMASRFANDGVDLVFAATNVENEIATYERIVETRRADVLILSGPEVGDARIQFLIERKIPVICHGQSAGIEGFNYYDVDNRGGFEKATNHLLDLGHRRIACLNGDVRMNFAAERQAGYEEALAHAGIELDRSLCTSTQMSDEEGFAASSRLCALSDPPTAFLCSSSLLAMGAARAFRQNGLVIGKDVALVAHDDVLPFMRTENFETPLTVLRAPIRDGGSAVADYAVRMLQEPTEQVLRCIEPVELIVRGSSCNGPFAS